MSSAELAKFEIVNTQHKVVNLKIKQESLLMGYLLHVVATWLVWYRFKSSQYYPTYMFSSQFFKLLARV